MKLIIKLLITVFALLLVSQYVPGIHVESLYIAGIVALILGVLNFTVKPVLWVLTLPINLLTLGLFSFILNAFLFWFVSTFVSGFIVDGFIPAFIGAFIVAIIHWLADKLIP